MHPDTCIWSQWEPVGCGIECLHEALRLAGLHTPSRATLLRDVLLLDGYDDQLGWKHYALAAIARQYGLECQPATGCTPARVRSDPSVFWCCSLQDSTVSPGTHLCVVNGATSTLFWPRGHPEYGERFQYDDDWLQTRLTGRGLMFGASARDDKDDNINTGMPPD